MNSKHPTAESHPMLRGRGEINELYREVVKCTACLRIVDFRTIIAREKRKQFMDWTYWGNGVPGYGDINGELLLVGLAPAAHGGNRTARVFTGDKSAEFLIMCLHEAGLANQPNSDALDDGLELYNTFMTPVLKCVPPQDKPTAEELRTCSTYFSRELELLKNVKVILALGKIAFDGCLKYYRQFYDFKMKDFPFGHDVSYEIANGIILKGSYHPSPRNVNTGRLNKNMMLKLLNGLPLK
jgi:uracil-DNA glycosylase family 4|tara:strand:- start:1162 stop:1881 length:720 start_codon:yes stop_codon:yes gene_type:complete